MAHKCVLTSVRSETNDDVWHQQMVRFLIFFHGLWHVCNVQNSANLCSANFLSRVFMYIIKFVLEWKPISGISLEGHGPCACSMKPLATAVNSCIFQKK